MNKIFLFILPALSAMIGHAQKPASLPILKTEVGNNLKVITDLTVTIDKVDDAYNPPYIPNPRYDVHYTVTNSGTEDINGLLVGLQANFYKSDGTLVLGNTNFGLAGPIAEQNEGRIIKPGVKVQRVVSVSPQQPLYFNASYKLVLTVDSQNKIAEGNENNNTSERPITPHSDYPETDYFLTGVTFNIQTGNDNKEATNSDVDFNFRTGGGTMMYRYLSYQKEIKANSTVSIAPNQCMIPNPPGPYSYENSLQNYKQNGIRLDIIYDNAKFATDAWKINGVSVTLQFMTRNGILSPTYGSKTINFPGAAGILGYRFGNDAVYNKDQLRVLMLSTAKTSYIDKLSGAGASYQFLTEENLAHF